MNQWFLFLGILEFQYSVEFENVENSTKTLDEDNTIVTKEQLISFRVEVEELPIYVKEKIIDFRCTLFDRIYRKKIEIFNRSRTACKIDIRVPKIFLKYIDIFPSTVFIQGLDSQLINIKLTPSILMLKKLAYFSLITPGFLNCASMSFPIEIQVKKNC